jgi:hypothetical protein
MELIESTRVFLEVVDDAPPFKKTMEEWTEANHLGFIKGVSSHRPGA